jgi:NADH-quinone oxidoreductase subunit E
MTVRRMAPEAVQPKAFAFTQGNDNWADGQIAKYPKGRQASAVIPLLWKAQEQAGGWLPQKAIEAVGQKLGMPYMRVFEIATFYTMFNLQPVGEHFVQVCGTVPCHLKGARDIIKVCEETIGPQSTVTADGKFSWLEVECLGACCNAPMVQINFDYYEDLTPENFRTLLADLKAGRPVKVGSQTGRSCSEPEGGGYTLKDAALYDGSAIGRDDWQARIGRDRAAAAEAARAAEAAKAAAAAGGAAMAAPAAANAPAPAPAAPQPPAPAAAPLPAATPSDADKPAMLAAPRDGKADDLKLIWGVGPKLEKMLHGMGVFHFDQIASWKTNELAWVDANLEGFKGRAIRDQWVDQSKKLATGWRPDSKLGDKPEGA